MTESDLIDCILQRLVNSQQAIFSADEIALWPQTAYNGLWEQGIVRRAQPAQVIECPGCENFCKMLVKFTQADSTRPQRAFIFCDKPADLSRVPVDANKLLRYQISLEHFAFALARILGMKSEPKLVAGEFTQWNLGMLAGRMQSDNVRLCNTDSLHLAYAGKLVPLRSVIELSDGKLLLDKERLLHHLANPAEKLRAKPLQRIKPSHAPSTTKREIRKLNTQATHQSWAKAYRKQLKEHPQKSDTWHARQIAKIDIGKDYSVDTIRKNMKLN